ncbi:hypothetical protein ACQ4WX_26075 [Streptomyces lasalocidi]
MSRDHDEMLTVLHERAPYAEIVLEPLDKTIDSAAGAHGSARFVGLYDSSRNHSVCDSGKWVEAIGVSLARRRDPSPANRPSARCRGAVPDESAPAAVRLVPTSPTAALESRANCRKYFRTSDSGH